MNRTRSEPFRLFDRSGAHGLSIDDPRTTEERRGIIRRKRFLHQIYLEWYRTIAACVPEGEGAVLELGSGAGFLGDLIPGLVTSEILRCDGVQTILDAQALPFREGSLRAIVMTDVLHHLPRVRSFFSEASRCVRAQGSIIMIEPWVTTWSRLVYHYLHHEPLSPNTPSWEFPSTGPLSGANTALPWILFRRDREQFEGEFPEWRITHLRLSMPFSYLLSGGLTRLDVMPGWTFQSWRAIERSLGPWMDKLAMFACIVLTRTDDRRRGSRPAQTSSTSR